MKGGTRETRARPIPPDETRRCSETETRYSHAPPVDTESVPERAHKTRRSGARNRKNHDCSTNRSSYCTARALKQRRLWRYPRHHRDLARTATASIALEQRNQRGMANLSSTILKENPHPERRGTSQNSLDNRHGQLKITRVTARPLPGTLAVCHQTKPTPHRQRSKRELTRTNTCEPHQ